MLVPELKHKVGAAQERERVWLEKGFGDELKQASEHIVLQRASASNL